MHQKPLLCKHTMASLTYILLLFMLASGGLYLNKPSSQDSTETEKQKVYIVRFNVSDPRRTLGPTTYMQVLNQVLNKGRSASDALIYSYKESLTGFAARLTNQERKKLEGIYGILGVEPSKNYELHTTRSWDFIGFPVNVPRQNAESDIIMGVFDTGIWPLSDSFSDDGLGPPPSKWKGKCENITCNNKIIGARSYYTDVEPLVIPYTVVDYEGHGTHVASTVAGRVVEHTSFFGLGFGIARGGVPSARIAVYKVCWMTTKGKTCPDHDILKAIDDAISDGVDIIQASLGSTSNTFNDPMAIGLFRAMKNGILAVASAGNKANLLTVQNTAPWILTVAASTIDRLFTTTLELGNGRTFTGQNLNTFPEQRDLYDLVLDEKVAGRRDVNIITYYDTYNVNDAAKINPKGIVATGDNCPIDSPILPRAAVCLTLADTLLLLAFLNSTGDPKGRIHRGRGVYDSQAPVVAWFSSKGPNPASGDILKPDITAPGFNILAAWSERGSVSDFITDERTTPYNIISGTSMACPHVSAIAAYIKTFHPTWSPSAIKSAIMTTATQMRPEAHSLAPFEYGSGQLNPRRALEPGLVYDATDSDYRKFLCADGYTESEVQSITGDSTATCTDLNGFTTAHLNYPSLSVNVTSNLNFRITFRRTLTNVESRSSVYTAHFERSSGLLKVEVSPTTLSFSQQGQKRDFTVTVSGPFTYGYISMTSLSWKDGTREVTSPIVIASV